MTIACERCGKTRRLTAAEKAHGVNGHYLCNRCVKTLDSPPPPPYRRSASPPILCMRCGKRLPVALQPLAGMGRFVCPTCARKRPPFLAMLVRGADGDDPSAAIETPIYSKTPVAYKGVAFVLGQQRPEKLRGKAARATAELKPIRRAPNADEEKPL